MHNLRKIIKSSASSANPCGSFSAIGARPYHFLSINSQSTRGSSSFNHQLSSNLSQQRGLYQLMSQAFSTTAQQVKNNNAASSSTRGIVDEALTQRASHSQTSKNQQSTSKATKEEPKQEQVLQIPSNINGYKLAKMMNVDPYHLLTRLQHLSREIYTDEFQILSKDAIETLGLEFEKEIEFIEDEKSMKNYKIRPPIVTIMGHVDHGKTTLLDSFRHSSRVKEEYGDITQSIGAFTFLTDSQHEITFIDTPGHEAFNNLRLRGAKVTDIIVLVISAIESVQPQTIEVIEIAQQMRIPVIVAINKIDRPAADVEAVLLDLSGYNLVPEQLGGEVICVPISAKEGTNLDLLEQKIIEVSETKLQLLEDFSVKAQCFVIESNFDEKTTQITATVLVKKGTLKQDDIFVCGINEGKVRFMINDQGKNTKIAYPGQAVKLGGFKSFPDVGNPLYSVRDHEEAQFIVSTIKTRREREETLGIQDNSKMAHELKKKVKKLSRIEKGKIYSGDKTVLYEKLGLIEESDIEKYRKKLGIKKGVDVIEMDAEDVDKALGEASASAPKQYRKTTGLKKAKKDFEKEEFKKIISDYQEEQAKLAEMDDEERKRYKEEKSKLKEMFRDEEVKYFPMIIKASTAGALETLLKETDKYIKGIYRINVIDSSVGPITEGDLNNAQQTGSVIFGFDVPCSPVVAKSAEPQGVVIKQHKIIYKFLEDIENFVMDVKQSIKEEEGQTVNIEILGTAQVSQIFKVKDVQPKGKVKMLSVAGSKVTYGELERKYKYRLTRNDRVIQDNLKLHSMKKLQQDVTKVEKGLECGLAFENFEGELLQGDVIECYKDSDKKTTKFNHKPGVQQSY